MLSETILNQEHIYESLLDKITMRADEVRVFENFLRSRTCWLTSPASTRFHMACPGGLVSHSLNVARIMLALRRELAPTIPEESCVIVALYHDVGKVGAPDKPYYLPGGRERESKDIGYCINKDLVHMDPATRSLLLVASYIPLTDEEAQAIRYHDGQYVEENRSVAHREERLTRLLQYADNWCGGVMEKNNGAL